MLDPKDLAGETWFVSLRSSGARAPLFCVCSSGGKVFDYSDLADALPGDQPVYVFGIPMLDPNAQLPAVEQLAMLYIQKIREVQTRGPLYLCGHSFGGIVAYEMARQLAANGQEVGLVALIDTEHPRLVQNLPVWRKAQFHFTYLLDRLRKYTNHIVKLQFRSIVADIQKFVRNHTKSIMWKVTNGVFKRNGRRIPEQIRSTEMIAETAWRSYVPGPYHGPVLLLNASERKVEYLDDPDLGWRHCVTGSITTHIVHGDHLNVMHPPQVATLAARLKSNLGAAVIVDEARPHVD